MRKLSHNLLCLRGRRGFTLIELMMAVVSGAALALAVGSVMYWGVRTTEETKKKIKLKQDGSFALRFVQRRVRSLASTDLTITNGGAGLSYTVDDIARSFVLNSGDLEYHKGAQTFVVIDDTTDSVTFAIEDGLEADSKLLRISLEISRDGHNVEMESLTNLRN